MSKNPPRNARGTSAPGQPPRKPRKTRKPRPAGLRPWLYGFYMAVALMTVIASAAVGIFIGYVRSLPPIEQLENYDPPEVARVYDSSGSVVVGEFNKKDERRQVVRIEEIPKQLRNAFIAIEDSRFYDHCGVDLIGIARAAVRNLSSGRKKEGASTITQQMTRNVLPEVGRERTILRKLKEMIQSLRIEHRYSKDQILEFYLNQIDFGSNSCGVAAAADRYFSKDLSQLTLAQGAVLAAIPKATTYYNPLLHPEEAHQRRDLVLSRMRELSMITEKQYQAALAEPLGLRPSNRATSRYPYFLDGLERDLKNYYHLDQKALTKGGLRITSTIDTKIQDACTNALRDGLVKVERKWQENKPNRLHAWTKKWNGVLRENDFALMEITKVGKGEIKVRLDKYRGTITLPDPLPFYEPEKVVKTGELIDIKIKTVNTGSGEITGELAFDVPVQGTMVVLDVHTGEVLALVGGTSFYAKKGGWYNYAVQGGRQVGSCFKPFVYAAGFERGICGPNDIIVDEPVEYRGDYRPINYEKNFEGPITLIRALEDSRNVPTIRLFEGMGIVRALDIVRRFDFAYEQPQWKLLPELSTCLGTVDSSPFEMASAYQVFANMGVGIRPQFFRSIVDSQGRIPFPIKRREEQVLKPISAYQIQYILRQVILRGTGRSQIGSKLASPPYPPIYGKTGTTNDCRDAWFIGFTPDLVITCQVGFSPKLSMGPGMTGGKTAGPIWREAFKEIIKSRKKWNMSFTNIPEGIQLVSICKATGKVASDFCSGAGHDVYLNVPFEEGKAPQDYCDGDYRAPVVAPIGSSYGYLAARARITGYAHYPTGGGGAVSGEEDLAGDEEASDSSGLDVETSQN